MTAILLDLCDELGKITKEIKWDIKGVIHLDHRISPLPAESRVVTEMFQSLVIEKMTPWALSRNIQLIDHAKFGRSYPDMTLLIDSKRIAIDVKSARVKKDDTVSRMTLGTYDGYFFWPDKKLLHNKTLCYNDYDEHWIIAVIYEWHPQKPTEHMVDIRQICVGQKWQFADKVSGSGDTAHIGGITSIRRLENLESTFENNAEFERFWREYSEEHLRRGKS